MTQDITPWLNEIKALQQKIVELQTELNAAQDSASQWRQLYNTEAQQRRNEAQQSQETIDNLKTKVQKLQKGFSLVKGDGDETLTTIEQEIEHLQTLAEFKAKILEVSQERDRAVREVQKLTTTLKQEQTNHANTRKSLTNALADAVDLLAKAKVTKQEKLETIPDSQLKTEINNPIQLQEQESKSPNTPQLPQNEKPLPRLPSSRD
ncbi:hypothetical protein [Hydrocoleum sp. CS-953]|uniref:hypothetical protein n=1 Tax=Microcoleaceae TaxID=1892252 RepID=UPI000BC83FDE|nr:hypothetical protein [Hydrocoleum sp. CS-953]OZH54383.1 hypothetical protein AFK68_11295 [Hydrocoleum sp. CS-953]